MQSSLFDGMQTGKETPMTHVTSFCTGHYLKTITIFFKSTHMNESTKNVKSTNTSFKIKEQCYVVQREMASTVTNADDIQCHHAHANNNQTTIGAQDRINLQPHTKKQPLVTNKQHCRIPLSFLKCRLQLLLV